MLEISLALHFMPPLLCQHNRHRPAFQKRFTYVINWYLRIIYKNLIYGTVTMLTCSQLPIIKAEVLNAHFLFCIH